MELECHEKILIRFGRWFWFELKKYGDMEKTKFQLLWKIKVLFEFVVSIIDNSVFITHNSKMVGPMAEKSVWIFIILFLVFVSMTQLSDFWVMSYGNWKYIWRRKKKKKGQKLRLTLISGFIHVWFNYQNVMGNRVMETENTF